MSNNVWGYWKCVYCDTADIRGDKRDCPNCGHPRDDDTKFYIKEGVIEKVSDDLENDNPDWVCCYCNSLNNYKLTECCSCGASKNSSEKDYFTPDKTQEDNQPDKAQEDNQFDKAQEDNQFDKPQRNSQANKPQNHPTSYSDIDYWNKYLDNQRKDAVITWHNDMRRREFITGFIGISVAILICSLVVFLIMPKTVRGEVKATPWQRTIEIEHEITVDESGWYLPTNARLHYTNTELKEYVSVFDHYDTKYRTENRTRTVGTRSEVVGYDDKGNGQFEEVTELVDVTECYTTQVSYTEAVYREEPVYATKYYYEIDKWVFLKNLITNGSDKNPYWSDISLENKQRVSDKYGKYEIGVLTDKIDYYELDETEWQNVNIGDEVEIKVNRITKKVSEIIINERSAVNGGTESP